jgi:hypothetical protein
MVTRHLRHCMPAVLRCAQIFSAMDLNPYRQHLKLAADLVREVCPPACVTAAPWAWARRMRL